MGGLTLVFSPVPGSAVFLSSAPFPVANWPRRETSAGCKFRQVFRGAD
ncbi:unnamed protein product [Staurois parvus]|uniref:Uncharacterized protein n=1 Tax=Staurois parvus TaxID=386267 RepID=A0ABN9DBW8_9NEOB|nr:unnamed protein product [Staurois parvus]